MLAISAAGVALLAPGRRTLWAGGLLYLGVLVGAFFVPTPFGQNALRLGVLAGPSVLALAHRKKVPLVAVAVVGAALLYLQWLPAVRAVAEAHGDPSTRLAFQAEARDFLQRMAKPGERVEVPLTKNHWEAADLAKVVPLARGWERQLDAKANPIFYDDEQLTPARYHDWLRENAVRFVALPNAPLDYSATAEALLLEGGVDYLELVYDSPRWRIWELRDPVPPASGGATLLAAGPELVHGQRRQADGRQVPLHAVLVDHERVREPRAGRVDAGRARSSGRVDRPGALRARTQPPRQDLSLGVVEAGPASISLGGSLLSRVLPRGPRDLAWQILLFCGAYWVYRLVRGQVYDQSAAAFANARDIVDLQQALHVFVEPDIQQWAMRAGWVEDVGSWMYLNTHFVVTTVTLAFIYLFRNEHFYWVRNMFMVAMGLALVGYVAFPTAPPRLMTEFGFTDSVMDFTGVSSTSDVNALYNPYAAVPSMHVGFALMLAISVIRMTRHRWVKVVWAIYPLVVSAVVVVTANHWIFDAVTGAAVAAVSALAAQVLFARVWPAQWAWKPEPGLAAPARAG